LQVREAVVFGSVNDLAAAVAAAAAVALSLAAV
jgi:hypothetical protein